MIGAQVHGQDVVLTGLEQAAESLGINMKRLGLIAQQTVNRGAARVRTRLDRTVRSEVRLSQSYVLPRIHVTQASLEHGKAEADVQSPKNPFLLQRYGARQETDGGKKAGVSVHVATDGPRKTIEKAFMVRLPNGVDAVAVRRTGTRQLKVLYGPDVDQMFYIRLPAIAAETSAWLAGEMNRRIAVESAT